MYVKREWHIVHIKCAGLILLGKFMDYYISLLEYFLYAPKK